LKKIQFLCLLTNPSNCKGTQNHLEEVFNNYQKNKQAELVVVFNVAGIALKAQIEDFKQYSDIKEVYFLDIEKYKKGNIHKKYESFLNDLRVEAHVNNSYFGVNFFNSKTKERYPTNFINQFVKTE